jgi:branched-subunit amino acid ABC-type transport system permease component
MFGQLFRLSHGVLLALSAIGFFVFWARTRFWLPTYVHILAAISFIVGLWCVANLPTDAPIDREGPIAQLLLAFIMPTIVYVVFVLYGGQRAAFKRRFERSTPCPYCKLPVAAVQIGGATPDPIISYAQQQCPHCGQSLA